MPSPRTVGVSVRSAAPIVDLRGRLHWRQRLAGRLGTGALWLGSFSLLGPVKLAGLLLTLGLVAPPALLFQRGRRQPLQPPSTPLPEAVEGLPRALVAAQLDLSESLLFRARHAAICTVHHDDQGRLVALTLPCPAPVAMTSSSDAHPVG